MSTSTSEAATSYYQPFGSCPMYPSNFLSNNQDDRGEIENGEQLFSNNSVGVFNKEAGIGFGRGGGATAAMSYEAIGYQRAGCQQSQRAVGGQDVGGGGFIDELMRTVNMNGREVLGRSAFNSSIDFWDSLDSINSSPTVGNGQGQFVHSGNMNGNSAMVPPGFPPKMQKKYEYECVFCKGNNQPDYVYKSHAIRLNDTVICPSLRSHICGICGATGDNAHTIKYCPFNNRGFFGSMKQVQGINYLNKIGTGLGPSNSDDNGVGTFGYWNKPNANNENGQLQGIRGGGNRSDGSLTQSKSTSIFFKNFQQLYQN